MTLALWEGPRVEGVAERKSVRRGAGPTYRRALEERLRRWDAFGSLLPTHAERAAFAQLTRGARRYVEEATYVGSPDLLESILLSVLLDLARRMPPGMTPSRSPRQGSAGPPREPSRSPRSATRGSSAVAMRLPLSTPSAVDPPVLTVPVPLRPPPALEATP
ncbi:MAG: hypothetical protein L3K07_00935 [Thermoplasmata archaeon]|nr:hypothetical protein [Thermoplasmata archaeon]